MEDWLSGGDLRSDGAASEVAALVVSNPALIGDLVVALLSGEPVVRGRAADALEKVARTLPREIDEFFETFLDVLGEDEVPMVRWHLAMLLGHLSLLEDRRSRIGETLMSMLEDESVFVVSWAIASLCILALQAEDWTDRVVQGIVPIRRSSSAALRTRAAKALAALTGDSNSVPGTWVKSDHLKHLTRPT